MEWERCKWCEGKGKIFTKEKGIVGEQECKCCKGKGVVYNGENHLIPPRIIIKRYG
jgi:DnaJ-class molecular chaperone